VIVTRYGYQGESTSGTNIGVLGEKGVKKII
jgi:hypothetical protein